MDYQDPFESTSAPALSFKNAAVGTRYEGQVTRRAEMVQSRDYTTREPLFWPDGNPKMAAVLNISVNGEERSVWAPKPGSMYSAMGAARNKLGRAVAPGDHLMVEFTGTKPTDDPRKEPQKLYNVEITPGGSDPFEPSQQNAPVSQGYAQPQAQAPRPAPQAQPQAQPSQPQGDVGGFMDALGAQADPAQLQAALSQLSPEMRKQLGLG